MSPIIPFCINSCKTTPGVYSCAIDTLCDLFFYGIFCFLTDQDIEILSNDAGLIGVLIRLCKLLNNVKDRVAWSLIRDKLWDWLLLNIPADFMPKGRSDASLDTSLLLAFDNSIFIGHISTRCQLCNSTKDKLHRTLILNGKLINDYNGDLKEIVQSKILSDRCCNITMIVQHYEAPEFLTVMLPVTNEFHTNLYTKLNVTADITIFDSTFKLTGGIRSTGDHFIPYVFSNNKFWELDGLRKNSKSADSFKTCAISRTMCKLLSCDEICDKQKMWIIVFTKQHRYDLHKDKFNAERQLQLQNNRREQERVKKQKLRASKCVKDLTDIRTVERNVKGKQRTQLTFNLDRSEKEKQITFARKQTDNLGNDALQKGKRKGLAIQNAKNKTSDIKRYRKRVKYENVGDRLRAKFLQDICVDNMFNCCLCTKVLYPEQTKRYYGTFKCCERLSNDSLQTVCDMCSRQLNNNRHPALCIDNKLDPGSCKMLGGLSYLEQKFVNLVNVCMTVTTLPGGQFAQNGQSIHFFNNNEDLLEGVPKDISDSALLVLEENGKVEMKTSKIVRLEFVGRCLWWLKAHNILFKESIIPAVFWAPISSSSKCAKKLRRFVPEVELSFISDDYLPPSLDSVVETLRKTSENKLNIFKLNRLTGPLLSIYQCAKTEEKSFVQLFPYGKNGYGEEREQKLTVQSYFKIRLEGKDNRFRSNISYIFWALNIFEQHRLQNQISIALKTTSLGNGKATMVDRILSDSSFTFVKGIRGTVGYWKCVLVDLLAKIKTLGPPTWFVTLSADDNHWSDVQKLCSYDSGVDANSSEILRQNPVMASKQFRRRWIAVFNWLKQSKALGSITDHFERVEFQNRGSPHLHIFLWVDNAPNLKTSEGRKAFPDFIDQYVSSVVPRDEEMKLLVQKYQMHKHTECCKGKGSPSKCRFKFPKPECKSTKLLPNISYTQSRKFYETKRRKNDIWVNCYNAELLRLWKANIDVQFVGNAHAVAAYVCDYICKSEPKKLRESIAKTISDIKTSSELSARQVLSKFGNTLIGTRCIGAYEACFRLLAIPLVNSTRTTVYINCRQPENRYRIVKPEKLCASETVEDEDICYLGLIEHYMRRPATPEFVQMSLLNFASWFTVITDKISKNATNQCYKLTGCDKYIRKRSKPACVRTNYVTLQTDPESYFLRLLMLHMPFRSENELKGNYKSYKESFSNRCCSYREKAIEQERFGEEFEKAIQQLRIMESNNTSDLVAHLTCDTNINEDSANDTLIGADQPAQITHLEITESLSNEAEMDANDSQIRRIERNEMTDTEFACSVAKLNEEQNAVFEKIKNAVQVQIESNSSERVRLFVTGKAGSGKSFLIATVYEMLQRIYNSSETAVLKCAPTGVASCNINGVTLHRALLLPLDFKYKAHYSALDPSRLQECRHFFRSVKFLIIDEISMVSYRVLTHIHRRLCELKCCEQLFGGINVLALGDFHQLRPVKDKFIFCPTADMTHLWNDNFETIELNTTMRQDKSDRFSQILDNVRIGATLTDVEMSLLKSRINAHLTEPDFSNALRIFPLRRDVDFFNLKMLQNLEETSNTKSIEILSIDTLISNTNSSSFENTTAPVQELNTTGLLSSINILVGARVMLIRNICLEDKLVNGSVGTVTQIINDSETASLVSVITVQFDHISFATDVERISVKYIANDRSAWERLQFPLNLSFASTIHKVQSLTLNKVVIDSGENVFEPAMSYVAISRVKKLSDLSFSEFSEKSLKAFESVKDYYKSSYKQ